jgi:hypothetical protein
MAPQHLPGACSGENLHAMLLGMQDPPSLLIVLLCCPVPLLWPQEYGLNSSIGPINVGVLAAGGSDDGGLGLLMKDNASGVSRLVEKEVKDMLTGALTCAMDVVTSNRTLHEALTSLLTAQERLEGAELARSVRCRWRAI